MARAAFDGEGEGPVLQTSVLWEVRTGFAGQEGLRGRPKAQEPGRKS